MGVIDDIANFTVRLENYIANYMERNLSKVVKCMSIDDVSMISWGSEMI